MKKKKKGKRVNLQGRKESFVRGIQGIKDFAWQGDLCWRSINLLFYLFVYCDILYNIKK